MADVLSYLERQPHAFDVCLSLKWVLRWLYNQITCCHSLPVSLSASFTHEHTSALSSPCTLTGYVHQFVPVFHFSVSVLHDGLMSAHPHLTLSVCLCLLQVFTVSVCDVSGSAGGGEHRPEYQSGGGEGAQSQRQRAGPDALPGGSPALSVRVDLSPERSVFWSP